LERQAPPTVLAVWQDLMALLGLLLILVALCGLRIPIINSFVPSQQEVQSHHCCINCCELKWLFLMRWIGTVSTVAGSVNGAGFFDGTGTNAKFVSPKAIAVDTQQNKFIGDAQGIRKLSASGKCWH
jgi:hypothetical protein